MIRVDVDESPLCPSRALRRRAWEREVAKRQPVATDGYLGLQVDVQLLDLLERSFEEALESELFSWWNRQIGSAREFSG